MRTLKKYLAKSVAILGLFALLLTGCDRPNPATPAPVTPVGGGSGTIRVRIIDRLGVGQVRESATITIGGVSRTINLNERLPSAYVEFYLPRPGQYGASFTSTVWYYHQGRLVPVYMQGQGTLTCSNHADFELVSNLNTNPPTLSLVRR